MRHEQGFAGIPERVAALGELAVLRRDGRNRIGRLFQEGSAKIRMPKTSADALEAVLINTAGGLTGGDRLDWRVTVGEGAAATVTSQACEKIYRASFGSAEVGCRLVVAAGGRLAWLPQETIVFDNASFRRQIDLELDEDAEALVAEATLFGRRAMGETVRRARFADRWRVKRAGRLIHAEEFCIGPDAAGQLLAAPALASATATATIALFADKAHERLEPARAMIGEAGGASAWRVGGTGKLLARLVAEDGYTLRKRLIPLLELLNGQAGLPKAWTL